MKAKKLWNMSPREKAIWANVPKYLLDQELVATKNWIEIEEYSTSCDGVPKSEWGELNQNRRRYQEQMTPNRGKRVQELLGTDPLLKARNKERNRLKRANQRELAKLLEEQDGVLTPEQRRSVVWEEDYPSYSMPYEYTGCKSPDELVRECGAMAKRFSLYLNAIGNPMNTIIRILPASEWMYVERVIDQWVRFGSDFVPTQTLVSPGTRVYPPKTPLLNDVRSK